MSLEFLAYGITLVIGVWGGYAFASYKKFKDLLTVVKDAVADDKITGAEIQKILEVIRR